MFRLEDNEVELGLGIHGEAGVKRIEVFILIKCLQVKHLKQNYVSR